MCTVDGQQEAVRDTAAKTYAAFGKITEGMDIVNKIAETATDYSDRPLEEQKMKKVTVDTMGVEYPVPERV